MKVLHVALTPSPLKTFCSTWHFILTIINTITEHDQGCRYQALYFHKYGNIFAGCKLLSLLWCGGGMLLFSRLFADLEGISYLNCLLLFAWLILRCIDGRHDSFMGMQHGH